MKERKKMNVDRSKSDTKKIGPGPVTSVTHDSLSGSPILGPLNSSNKDHKAQNKNLPQTNFLKRGSEFEL